MHGIICFRNILQRINGWPVSIFGAESLYCTQWAHALATRSRDPNPQTCMHFWQRTLVITDLNLKTDIEYNVYTSQRPLGRNRYEQVSLLHLNRTPTYFCFCYKKLINAKWDREKYICPPTPQLAVHNIPYRWSFLIRTSLDAKTSRVISLRPYLSAHELFCNFTSSLQISVLCEIMGFFNNASVLDF